MRNSAVIVVVHDCSLVPRADSAALEGPVVVDSHRHHLLVPFDALLWLPVYGGGETPSGIPLWTISGRWRCPSLTRTVSGKAGASRWRLARESDGPGGAAWGPALAATPGPWRSSGGHISYSLELALLDDRYAER